MVYNFFQVLHVSLLKLLILSLEVFNNLNNLQLFKRHVHYDLRKYYFGNRIISHWHSLPDNVINSYYVGVFENRLDLFWKCQDCYYN